MQLKNLVLRGIIYILIGTSVLDQGVISMHSLYDKSVATRHFYLESEVVSVHFS